MAICMDQSLGALFQGQRRYSKELVWFAILPNFRVNFLVRFCLETLILLGSALALLRKFFGAVRAMFWLWGSFWPLNHFQGKSSETRLIRLTFWDTLWEHFGLSDQSALIDASLWKETPLKPVQILKHTTFYSAEQTAMRAKWFKHIAI